MSNAPFSTSVSARTLAYCPGRRIFSGFANAPAILLVHEPYFFPWVPDRIALTLAGHMHGGQVNLPIIGPPVSLLKRRSGKYIYGEYALGEKRMIVSGGLGTSLAPVRILRPPEVVMVKLGGDGGFA